MTSRTLVIVNPKSANGSTAKKWPKIRAAIEARIGSFDEVQTRGPGDATVQAREGLRDGHDHVVSVGGDGTLNEVVNGFFDEDVETAIRPEAELSVVSSGTGGDFRRSLAQDKRLPESVAHLDGERSLTVDVGRIECESMEGKPVRRLFLNIASFGISGKADETVNRSSKALGTLAFVLGIGRTLATYRPQPVRIRVGEGEWHERRVLCVSVANGRYFGAGLHMAPLARLDDGFFDIVELGELSAVQLLRLAPRLYRGDHLELDGVHLVRGTRLEATSEEEVLIDLDGEMPGRLPLVVDLLPAALKLRVRY